jgi:hypothetical protein
MEITKEKLMTILSENYIKDIEEMAVRKEKSKKDVSKIYDDEDSPERQLIGWEMRKEPGNPESEWFAAIFTCDIDSFKEKHRDLISKLESEYGDIHFSTDNCPTARPLKSTSRKYFSVKTGEPTDPGAVTGYKPTNSWSVFVDGVLYKNFLEKDGDAEQKARELARRLEYREGKQNVTVEFGGTKKSVSENIKREFKEVLRNELGNDSPKGKAFEEVLNKRSLPGIIVGDTKYEDNHTDIWQNEKVEFRTHSFNIYPNSSTFLKAVIARATGKDANVEMQTGYLARQFNQNQTNWDANKTIQKTNYGKTGDPGYVPSYFRRDTYNLNVSGIYAGENEIALKMLFDVRGEKIGDSFVWSVKMKNSFGKRDESENWASRFQPIEYKGKDVELSDNNQFDDKSIIQTTTVQLDPQKKYGTENNIMTDPIIRQGLIDTIDKFKQKVESISPGHAIQYAAQRPKFVNEIKSFNNIIKSAISEAKRGYKLYHDSYTSAINDALEYAENSGYTYDKEETATKIGSGPKKPSEGKTNRITIGLKKDDKEQKKSLHIQVYNMGEKYELNTYIN